VGKFFEVAGIALPQSYQKLSGNSHNASLTPAEAALVQLTNARFPKGDFPATLSKLLLRRPEAERKGGSFYSVEIDTAILSAVRPVVEDINKNIIGEPLRTNVRSEPDSSPAIGQGEIACLLKAVDTALRATANREARPSVYAWAKSLFSRKSAKLPADFSPEAYLFHNEDVAGAGVDPGLHYLSHGKLEQRRYRFS
jgi:hypothetical protein